ncbi:MAG: VCBS repeat-containing protein [Planctomycetota bacterium]
MLLNLTMGSPATCWVSLWLVLAMRTGMACRIFSPAQLTTGALVSKLGRQRCFLVGMAVPYPGGLASKRTITGWSASGTGDANGDGLPDLIVGMFHTTPPSVTGYAALFSGRTSQRLYRFEGDLTVYDQYGYSVSGAGDINRDGFADVMIGVPNHDPYGSDSGAALVFAGSRCFSMQSHARRTLARSSR